jgi:hypothetical protein
MYYRMLLYTLKGLDTQINTSLYFYSTDLLSDIHHHLLGQILLDSTFLFSLSGFNQKTHPHQSCLPTAQLHRNFDSLKKILIFNIQNSSVDHFLPWFSWVFQHSSALKSHILIELCSLWMIYYFLLGGFDNLIYSQFLFFLHPAQIIPIVRLSPPLKFFFFLNIF